MNDKSEERETIEINLPEFIAQIIFCAFGISTVFFAPLPIIYSHKRLLEPWSKLSVLLGSVGALLFLETPIRVVVFSFVFGLFIADGINQNIRFWKLLVLSIVIALVLMIVNLQLSALFIGTDALSYWRDSIHAYFSTLKSAVTPDVTFEWARYETLFVQEGLFIYISAAILSFWLSIGSASHFGFLDNSPSFSPNVLRKLQLSPLASLFFFSLLMMRYLDSFQNSGTVAGLLKIIGCLLFIRGCNYTSQLMMQYKIQRKFRTVVYFVLIPFGFILLIGIGFIRGCIDTLKHNTSNKGVSLSKI